MQNENIAICKSATWKAIYKKSATRKIVNMKILLHKKAQHGNRTVSKKSNMKKYKLQPWNTNKLHKNSAL